MSPKSGPKSPKEARAERLRSALRENLKRRKAQARGRSADEARPDAGAATVEDAGKPAR